MKASEIRDLADNEVLQRLEDARHEMFNLRFQKATGQLKDPSRVRFLKRDIARCLTLLREREIVADYQAYLAQFETVMETPEPQEQEVESA